MGFDRVPHGQTEGNWWIFLERFDTEKAIFEIS